MVSRLRMTKTKFMRNSIHIFVYIWFAHRLKEERHGRTNHTNLLIIFCYVCTSTSKHKHTAATCDKNGLRV